MSKRVLFSLLLTACGFSVLGYVIGADDTEPIRPNGTTPVPTRATAPRSASTSSLSAATRTPSTDRSERRAVVDEAEANPAEEKLEKIRNDIRREVEKEVASNLLGLTPGLERWTPDAEGIDGTGEFFGGLPHGEWMYVASDGRREGGPYVFGVQRGEWRSWNPQGDLVQIVPYHLGEMHGTARIRSSGDEGFTLVPYEHGETVPP